MEAKKANDYKFDISHLNLHYGDFHALKDVNMKIEANKITAFIGPSGCGKSTFLKTLNRMNDLVENCKIDGNVLLDGKDIYQGYGRDHTASSCWNGISAAKSISKECV